MLWADESGSGVESVLDGDRCIFAVPKVRGRKPTRDDQVKDDVPSTGLSGALVVEFKQGILWSELFRDGTDAVWCVSRIGSYQLSLSVESDDQGL